MRASLLIIALALTACGRASASSDDLVRRAEQSVYAEKVRAGVAPADARQQILEARAAAKKLEDDPEANYREAQRQQALNDLRADQCRREPYLKGC